MSCLLPEKIDVSLLNEICSDNGWDVKWTIKEPKEGIELLNDIYKLNHEGKEEVKHLMNHYLHLIMLISIVYMVIMIN